MCGICGKIYTDRNRRVEQRILEAMTRLLIHRGPDEDGYYLKENAGLGHRRLSIIDLSGGQQPISNEDGTLQIICNGEIYNYRPLMDELKAKRLTSLNFLVAERN